MKIGCKIKNIRKDKKYTLKTLSEITGLSIGFLSNIERDLNSPSISNLQQICSALGVNLMEIFNDEHDENPVTRTTEREEIFSNNTLDVKVESLLNGKSNLNGIAISLTSENNNFTELSWGHGFDEIGIVIEGCLEIELDKETYHLEKGDSIVINANTPHRYRNPKNSISTTYWFSVKK